MFTICIEFLQGRVATATPSDSSVLEWPVEPARLFMAMVAAHFESDGDEKQSEMLRWFEALPSPTIHAPTVFKRTVCTTFVVVNDAFGSKQDPLARNKKPRTFASGYVGDAVSRYHYEADISDQQSKLLSRNLANVVRIGHSSSLVRCWLETETTEHAMENTPDDDAEFWTPTDVRSLSQTTDSRRMRVARGGTLTLLDRFVNRAAIEEYDELAQQAFVAKATKESRAAKKEIKTRYPNGSPQPRPIKIETRQLYAKVESTTESNVQRTEFDPGLIVLSLVDGNRMGLESTAKVCEALRNCLLKDNDGPAPAWLSGHDANGSATKQTHLAFVPLAHVGRSTSVDVFPEPSNDDETPQRKRSRRDRNRDNIYDGHLLGLAIVLPRDVADADANTRLASSIYGDDGDAKDIELTLGRLGKWTVRREDRDRCPIALTPETWTRASHTWATVTPIVLDRFPKQDRAKDPTGWRAEVESIVRRSCTHIGIDADDIHAVRIGPHGMVSGVPSSRPDRGFPMLAGSDGKTRRMQTHAVIQFKHPVLGPVIIGSGRFRGYGFCKPVEVQS